MKRTYAKPFIRNLSASPAYGQLLCVTGSVPAGTGCTNGNSADDTNEEHDQLCINGNNAQSGPCSNGNSADGACSNGNSPFAHG